MNGARHSPNNAGGLVLRDDCRATCAQRLGSPFSILAHASEHNAETRIRTMIRYRTEQDIYSGSTEVFRRIIVKTYDKLGPDPAEGHVHSARRDIHVAGTQNCALFTLDTRPL